MPRREWELVLEEANGTDRKVERLRVDGGWIYLTQLFVDEGGGLLSLCHASTVFVPSFDGG